jgi:glutamate dehydrogenase (NAD(P)+)
VVTGKPVHLGGSAGRDEATGSGVALIAQAAGRDFGLDLAGARVVLQGFGNVGSFAARSLHAMGARIVAVGAVRGSVQNPKGFDVPALLQHFAQHRTVVGFPDSAPIPDEALLELPCELLIPAALGGVIDARRAERVHCKLLVEAANNPLTPGADEVLEARDIVVIPDILANAGGVTVSYFEWVQNRQEFAWKLDRVRAELREILLRAYREVYHLAFAEKVSLRTAAYMLAIERVSTAARLRWLD